MGSSVLVINIERAHGKSLTTCNKYSINIIIAYGYTSSVVVFFLFSKYHYSFYKMGLRIASTSIFFILINNKLIRL